MRATTARERLGLFFLDLDLIAALEAKTYWREAHVISLIRNAGRAIDERGISREERFKHRFALEHMLERIAGPHIGSPSASWRQHVAGIPVVTFGTWYYGMSALSSMDEEGEVYHSRATTTTNATENYNGSCVHSHGPKLSADDCVTRSYKADTVEAMRRDADCMVGKRKRRKCQYAESMVTVEEGVEYAEEYEMPPMVEIFDTPDPTAAERNLTQNRKRARAASKSAQRVTQFHVGKLEG